MLVAAAVIVGAVALITIGQTRVTPVQPATLQHKPGPEREQLSALGSRRSATAERAGGRPSRRGVPALQRPSRAPRAESRELILFTRPPRTSTPRSAASARS
jgi:hypothetical protein